MRIVAPAEVGELVRHRGGRLYVWSDRHRWCGGGLTLLRTGVEPAPGREFRRIDADGRFDLFIDVSRSAEPDHIVLDVKGWRTKRVDAYWDGCVFAP